ncbi:hypothetical protein DFP72DRAFT_846339 [Ephemerocybe angulata]|uniref:Uncharacterized protein n=1 Tax=Ephemerocybe angulata TaxID=980116 RepID=A0A8H6I1D4_9AGAR|nr:hypothetical protein DFP72DRAFT_846339 [Tulosesus angulatus]
MFSPSTFGGIVALTLLTPLNLVFLHNAYVQRREAEPLTALSTPSSFLFKHMPVNQVALEFKIDSMPISDEELWTQLVPENGGVVETADGKFVVAMYHQLRCLEEVRVAFLAAHNRPIPGRVPNATAADICLGQLWQILQCNADITLDPAVLVERNGALVPGSSGEGVDHRCNDWTRVRDVVEGRRSR